jgi:hypothetical protein
MALLFVASGGSNTSPYETWAKAATSVQTMLSAMSAGDIGVIQYNAVPSGDAENAANVTYTLAANCTVVAASNDGGSAFTPTAMGTSNWIGNSTASRSITIAGAFRARFSGLTFRTAGSTTASTQLLQSDGAHFSYEDCYIWHGTTHTSSHINLGTADVQGFAALRNCTLRFGHADQRLFSSVKAVMEGGSVASAGSAPTIFLNFTRTDPGGATFDAVGVDLSHLGSGTLVGDSTTSGSRATFAQCKMGSGYVMLSSQTVANRSGAEVQITDCASGDTHGLFGYADALGTVTSEPSIYVTAGAAAQSWKIVTTANAGPSSPFRTPWMGKWNATLSSMTTSIEILRDGSATAYQDDEVWAEFMAKVTSGSTASSIYGDRCVLGASPANQATGAGTGAWTGEGGTAWSGKIDSGSAFTPAEVGEILARICVGEPSITVYANPELT